MRDKTYGFFPHGHPFSLKGVAPALGPTFGTQRFATDHSKYLKNKQVQNRNKQNLWKRADVAAIAEGVIGAALSFALSLPRLAKKGQKRTTGMRMSRIELL